MFINKSTKIKDKCIMYIKNIKFLEQGSGVAIWYCSDSSFQVFKYLI